MINGVKPKITDEGTGGTYLLYLTNEKKGRKPMQLFKPKDEEVYGPMNPRGFPGYEDADGVRPGVYSTQQ